MSYREILADQVWSSAVDESRLYTFDFTLAIPGDTINAISGTSGAYTLGVTGSALITIGTPAINVATITDDDGDTIAIGKAVQVRLSPASGVVGTTYPIRCLCTTTAGDRVALIARLQVID